MKFLLVNFIFTPFKFWRRGFYRAVAKSPFLDILSKR